MELSSVNEERWQAALVQVGLVVLGAFSVVILLSSGGQLIVAPGLLPAQWLVARATRGLVAKTFSILGGLLLLEVVPLGAMVLMGDSWWVWIVGVAVAVTGAVVFYRTSQDLR